MIKRKTYWIKEVDWKSNEARVTASWGEQLFQSFVFLI